MVKYLMRDRQGKIIYIGKAVSLKKRVQSYFRESTFRKAQPKVRGLIRSIENFDFIELKSDAEAMITESRLINEYKPRYNTLLKDDKSFLMIRTYLAQPFPRFETCRIQKYDGATYFAHTLPRRRLKSRSILLINVSVCGAVNR